MNLRKLRVEELKELAIKYNSIIGEYSPATLLEMNKKDLLSLIYEWTTLNDSQIEYYIYKDIKRYLYKLEGQKISFEYEVTTFDNSISDYFKIPKQETVKESYFVKDFMIKEKYKGINKLNNKIKELFQVRNYTTFRGSRLNSFYKEFMKMVKEETIFSKLKGI